MQCDPLCLENVGKSDKRSSKEQTLQCPLQSEGCSILSLKTELAYTNMPWGPSILNTSVHQNVPSL
uniref:Uncharacterized protein n=1 Tax=Aegilops tauschii subsp. strangulata TaxID=200361 RepID=A0A453D419_AEGTS